MTTLQAAAQAVLDRWNSPRWEWASHGPTADLMHALRTALAQPVQPAKEVTADQLFASDDVMALNSKYGLRMDELMKIVRVIEAAISTKETP